MRKWKQRDGTSAPAGRTLYLKKGEGMEAALIIHPKTIHQCAVDHGWWDRKREVPELLCLVHSEVSEALEAYRKGEEIAEELADIVIRVFDMSEHLNVDIIEEVRKKHEINLTRPYRHGGKEA